LFWELIAKFDGEIIRFFMAEVAEASETIKAYDLEKEQWADIPVPADQPAKKDDDDPSDKADAAKDDEPEKEKSEEKESEKEPEKEDDKPKDEDPKTDDKKDEEQDPAKLNEVIKARYAEKYEIESLEDLDEILEVVDKITEDNDRLKEQLEAAKKAEPTFANEAQKKAYEFIKDFDPSMQGEALKTWANVVSMDIDRADGKAILRENFILSRPELSRQDAEAKFERDFIRKYVPKMEKYDSDEEYEEAKKDAEIDLKADIAAARKALKEKQKEFQYKPADKEPENKAPEVPAEIRASIKTNVAEMEAYQAKTSELVISPTGNKEDAFPVKFSKNEWNAIKTITKGWVSNPASYDKNGELLTALTPAEATERAALLLFGKDIMKKMYEHAKTVVSIQRVEEVGKVKPNRESKVSSATAPEPSEDEQWAALIEKIKKGKS